MGVIDGIETLDGCDVGFIVVMKLLISFHKVDVLVCFFCFIDLKIILIFKNFY